MAATSADRQAPRAAAVVLTTGDDGDAAIAAARSIFAQARGGPIQLLVAAGRADAAIARMRAECPGDVLLTVLAPDLPAAAPAERPDGAPAAALAFLANSPLVAFLDDRHRLAPGHLGALRRAIEGRAWAATRRAPGLEIEDVAPGDRPNLMMVDKRRHGDALIRLAAPAGMAAPDLLRALEVAGPGGRTGVATVASVAPAAASPRSPPAPAAGTAAVAPAGTRLAEALAPWAVPPMAPAEVAPLDPPADRRLAPLVATLRPEAAVVLGAAADGIALALATAARDLGLSTVVAAIDPFVGGPDDLAIDRRRAALPRAGLYPLLYDRLVRSIDRHGLAGRLLAVPAEPAPVLAHLAASGVRVALGHADLAAEREDFRPDLDALWPIVAPGGAVFGHVAVPDLIGREMQVRRWAARAGAGLAIGRAGADGRAMVVLRRR